MIIIKGLLHKSRLITLQLIIPQRLISSRHSTDHPLVMIMMTMMMMMAMVMVMMRSLVVVVMMISPNMMMIMMMMTISPHMIIPQGLISSTAQRPPTGIYAPNHENDSRVKKIFD